MSAVVVIWYQRKKQYENSIELNKLKEKQKNSLKSVNLNENNNFKKKIINFMEKIFL